MLGAILGDIIGSPYEAQQNNIHSTDFPLFTDKSQFTDDTVMTAAVGLGLMDSWGMDDEGVKESLAMNMRSLGRSYPARGYGGHFQAWILVNGAPPYGSFGNGSAMRVSAAGWLYRTLDETLHAAELTAVVTHNHPEGIKGAKAIAAAIFLARARCEKQDIRNYLMREFKYDLTTSVKEYRKSAKYSVTCQDTVPMALAAFFEGSGFVDTIRKAVSMGGDSDTIAAMAGSIAEAYYGIPENLEKEAYRRLDDRLGKIVAQFHSFYYQNSGRQEDGWQAAVYYNPDNDITDMAGLEQAITAFYQTDGQKPPKPDAVFDELLELMNENANILIPVRQPSRDLSREKRSGGVEVQCIADNDGNIMMPLFTSQKNLGARNEYVLTTDIDGYFQSLLGSEGIYGIIINPFGENFVLTRDVVRYLVEKQETIRDQVEKQAMKDQAAAYGKEEKKNVLSVGKQVDPDASREDVPEDFVPDEGEPEFRG